MTREEIVKILEGGNEDQWHRVDLLGGQVVHFKGNSLSAAILSDGNGWDIALYQLVNMILSLRPVSGPPVEGVVCERARIMKNGLKFDSGEWEIVYDNDDLFVAVRVDRVPAVFLKEEKGSRYHWEPLPAEEPAPVQQSLADRLVSLWRPRTTAEEPALEQIINAECEWRDTGDGQVWHIECLGMTMACGALLVTRWGFCPECGNLLKVTTPAEPVDLTAAVQGYEDKLPAGMEERLRRLEELAAQIAVMPEFRVEVAKEV